MEKRMGKRGRRRGGTRSRRVGLSADADGDGDGDGDRETPARASGERERVTPVRASATLLVAIRHHLRLARRLPALAPDVSLRIAELVKVYNARACQLVLGAGAMRSSGLRSITARHLALAHRSLRVALAATRAARDALEPLVPESRRDVARREFDRAAADLSAHEAEIRAKLVAIMRDRVPFHARRLLRAVDAEMKGEGDANGGADGNEGGSDENEGGVDGNRAESDGNRGESESSSDGSRAFAPMDFASGLRSEISTLRRVVAGVLSRRDAKTVFRAVAAALDESAADALEASIPSPPKDAVTARARRRMAAEGEALARTLHRLRLGDDDASGDDQDANASGTGSGSESESAPRLAAFARRAREE